MQKVEFERQPARANDPTQAEVVDAAVTAPTPTAFLPLEPRTPTPVPAAEPAYLTVNVDTWAEVFLDQKPVGQTPINRLPIEPGQHEVWLHNPKSLHEDFQTFRAEPGGSYRIVGELKEPY